MAAQNLTTFDASLKDFYEGKIRRILQRQVRMMNYLKKGAKPFEGRQVVFPINVQGSPGFVYMTAGGDLAAATPQTTVDVRIPIRQGWGRIQLTYDVIKAAATNRGAFERPLAFELKRFTQDAINKGNRSCWGDGTGIIGEVDSYNAGTAVITCRNLSSATAGTALNSNAGNRYIKVGDLLDVYTNAATPLARNQGVKVNSLSLSANTITVTLGTGTNPVAGDRLYVSQPSLGTPYNMDPMGIGGIVDDGTYVPVLHNVDRTAATGYPIWQAQVITLGTGPLAGNTGSLSLDILQRAIDAASEGAAGYPALIVGHYSARREALKLMVTDRRYTEVYKYEPGIDEDHMDTWPWKTTASYDGVPFVFEKDCPWQTLFFLDPEALRKWVLCEMEWVNMGGANEVYLVPGKAGLYEAQATHMYNIGTDENAPSSCTVVRNIASTIDRVNAP